MSTRAFTITNSGTITITLDNKVYSIGTEHMNYAKILEALKTKQYDNIPVLANISTAIQNSATKAGGNVDITNGLIYYKGFIVDNSLTRRILEMIAKDYPFDPMLKFFENLMENPSQRAVTELYNFLDVNNIPITEDGCFLAYKRVREDYMDIYSGTIDNSVGQVVKMDRKLVNDDSNETCSVGLHACSIGYLTNFHNGEGHVMILKINPRDVVSIPVDYHNTKMRVCEYAVVKELEIDENNPLKDMFSKPVYTAQGDESTLNEGDDTDESVAQFDCSDCDPCEGCPSDGVMTNNACNDCDPCEDCKNVNEDYDPCADCEGLDGCVEGCGDCVGFDDEDEDNQDAEREAESFVENTPKAPKRDKSGRFVSKMGVKPDGTAFWNKRDKFGKFVRK